MINLSPDQAIALERLMAWYKKPTGPAITLGGYAGTGKTTLMSILRQELAKENDQLSIAFAAFTGKASQVLRNQLEAQHCLLPQDTCGTIHALLYKAEVDKEGRLLTWNKSKKITADLIIIDEASMVTDSIWMDLLSYQKPIIALGDHGQLPPIGGHFNLMQKPDITLEHIHRQAEGNPIIQLAHHARTTGEIPVGDYSASVRKFSYATHDAYEINDLVDHLLSNLHDDMLVLCGRNKTRTQLNQSVREKAGRESAEPESGERVVCLKNNYDKPFAPIYNGMTGIIQHIEPFGAHWYKTTIHFPDEDRTFEGVVSKYQFHSPILIETVQDLGFKEIGDRFDFGYALTVHKAQGSQAKTVVLFEERFQKVNDEEWRRWLYTAVTRARENLYIIGPK